MSEIDVSKCIYCEYYNDGICNQTTLYAPTSKQVAKCKDIDCCFIKDFYKQLQQLKAENEELKDETICLRAEIEKQKERYKQYINSKQASYEEFQRRWQEEKERADELQSENEELKYKLSDTERRLVELSKANTHNLVLLQRRNKCLDEIEEIANAIVNGTHFTTDIEGHFKELTKQILQLVKQAKEVNVERIYTK